MKNFLSIFIIFLITFSTISIITPKNLLAINEDIGFPPKDLNKYHKVIAINEDIGFPPKDLNKYYKSSL